MRKCSYNIARSRNVLLFRHILTSRLASFLRVCTGDIVIFTFGAPRSNTTEDIWLLDTKLQCSSTKNGAKRRYFKITHVHLRCRNLASYFRWFCRSFILGVGCYEDTMQYRIINFAFFRIVFSCCFIVIFRVRTVFLNPGILSFFHL